MIIAMSAASADAKIDLLELAQRLGAQYRMTKPFQLQTVLELVKDALARKLWPEESEESIGSDKKGSQAS